MVPLDDLGNARPGAAGREGSERTIVAQPIQNLFGGPAGYVTARIGDVALDEPRRAFIAKVSLTTAGVCLAGLLAAWLIAGWLPWRARRVAHAIERHLAALYRGIGANQPAPALPAVVPPRMARALARFTAEVEAREHELRAHADAVDLLDEAA